MTIWEPGTPEELRDAEAIAESTRPPRHCSEVAAEQMLVADVLRRLGDWEHPEHSDVEHALRESIRALGNLVPSSFVRRPVEVRVAVEDEEGCEVNQTVSLTRAQGDTPAVLGGTLGNLVASVLGGLYVGGGDLSAAHQYADALDATIATLRARQ